MHACYAIKFVIAALALVVAPRTQGADTPTDLSKFRPIDLLRMPLEKGTTNRPVIAKHFDGYGPYGVGKRSILVCVWADGRVLWSTNRSRIGGEPYFEGQIDAKRITELLRAVEANGYFTNTVLQNKGYFPIHAPCWHWSILSDGRACEFSSVLDFGETLSAHVNQDELDELADLITAWRFLDAEIQKILPKTGRKAERFEFTVKGVRD